MQNLGFEDRRIFERIPVKLPLKYLDLQSNKESLAQTRDISAEGIGLVTDREFLPGAPLEIWLEIPDKGEPLYVKAEVVWSRVIGLNKYRSGISLEKPQLLEISRVLRLAA
jgi:Tfp pilus assembly protein PilZ